MTTPMAHRVATTALVGLTRFIRAARPVVRRGLAHAGRASLRGAKALGRGLGALGRLAYRRRAVIFAATHRVAWWAALGLLVMGGRPVLGLEAVPERWIAVAPFVAGLVLCAAVRLLAPSRRLRVAALGLGALHGTAAVLVWTAFAG